MESSSTLISSELDGIKNKEVKLLTELGKVQETITSEITKLKCLPTLIGQAKNEHAAFTSQAKLRYHSSKSIPGSDEEDQTQIADVDGIHLRAVEAQKALGLL